MVIRTVKYEFLPSGHFTVRYLWYLYYIPMLFIPLLMFLSVLTIGKPHNKSIDRRWYFLFIPAAVIFLGIFTNDLHQKAFFFKDGLSPWHDGNITRGFVYYSAITWIVLLSAAMLAVVFVRCGVRGRLKMIWLPVLPLFLGLLYVICDLLGITNLLTYMFRAPEIGCIVFAAFMEALICVRLFPTNDNYGAFWNASSISAGIMDKNGTVRYKSQKSMSVTPDNVRRAQTESVPLDNGRLNLKSHAIHGGYGYWVRDVSEIKRLNDELEELGNVTAEENSMLKAETKMKAERIRIEEQNKLYDDMAKSVKKQLDVLNGILDAPPEKESEFEKSMQYACILNAYIKRHSNLLLLSHRSNYIYSEELRYAVIESLEYVRLSKINTYCSFDGKENLPARIVMLAYEVFESVLESSVNGADNILAYLKISKDGLFLQMEINNPREIFSYNCMYEKINTLSGNLEIETDESTEYITLTLPSGGESA